MFALNQTIQRLSSPPGANRVGAIGLECAVEQLHLVQLELTQSGDISVRATASSTYPEARSDLLRSPRRLRELVKETLAKARFKGRKVVTALPSGETRIVPVHYRVGAGQSEAGVILRLMEDRLDGPLGDYVIDFLPIRSNSNADERSALVAIAKRESVIAYLEALRKSGLDVECLEIGPVAIRRLITAMAPEDRLENVLAINFGREASFLTIISGNRLLFDQSIQFGERMLLAKMSDALDMPEASVRKLVESHGLDPEPSDSSRLTVAENLDVSDTLQEIAKPLFIRLVDEISRVLIYVASQTHGESVDRIYLLGSIARWRGADQLLNRLLTLPVQTVPNPLNRFLSFGGGAEHIERESAPEIAIATGLALRSLAKP